MITGEEFLRDLREALNHLYDPDYLRHSSLATVFGVAERFDTPAAVQRILTETIESLRPDDATPIQSPAWRVYDLLFYRYVQQASQQEVADQLGVSVRQFRREQHAALETMAYELWTRYDLGEQADSDDDRPESGASSPPAADEIVQALDWLKHKAPDVVTVLDELVPPVVDLAMGLCRQHRVELQTKLPAGTPNLAAHPIAVRQMLLNLLSTAIPRATGGTVTLQATRAQFDVEFSVRGEPDNGDGKVASLSEDEVRNLQVAEEMAKMSGGRLSFEPPTLGLAAKLTLPAAEQVPILILDDNIDTLQLLQRYTSGTRYQAFVTQDPEALISLAADHHPCAIVLDVMMPEIDGWEVIGRLQQHPNTNGVPIIVCSILAQTELALSLGASAYVQKPLKRQAFLDALDRHGRPQEPAPAKGSH